MALQELVAQTTRMEQSALMKETFIAPTMLPVCCVCGLIRGETGPSPDHKRWVTLRSYRKIHDMNPAAVSLTHSYCPDCFTQINAREIQYLWKGYRFSPIPETPTVHRREP
jgi:hypothetical protein